MPRLILIALLALSWIPASPLPAGEPDGDALLEEYFRAETQRVRDAALKGIDSREDWEKRRPKLKEQLASMLGLHPLPERTPLNVEVTGTIERDDIIVEKVRFESRPGLYVTGNLYRPSEQDGPLPGILYVCGHAQVKEDGISYGNKTHYQHHGVWFARNGYVCLTIDTLQLGEIEGLHHGVYPRALKPSSTKANPVYDTHGWWYSRGYTPAGVETWNGMRGIDYLQSREEVDPDKIGVTGRSGGGAYSWFIAAMDERVKAAVPVAGITDLQDHVVHDCIEGHCDCMFYVNFHRWDFPLLAAMIAPRPLLISNTDKDRIFPLEGVQRVHAFTKQIYDLYEAPKHLGLHITEGPHADTQELRIHAFVWFDRFLKKGDRRVVQDPGDKPFEPEELKVFERLPGDEINTRVDQTFVAKANVPEVPKSQNEWEELKAEWLKPLAKTTFGGWPEAVGSPTAELINTTETDGVILKEYRVATQTPFELPLYLVTREGLDPSAGFTFRPVDQEQWEAFATAMEILKPEHGADAKSVQEWRERIQNLDKTLVVFAPRGIGTTAWTDDPKERVHIRRRFMLLGQTQAGMRAWDVLAAREAMLGISELNGPAELVATGPKPTTWALHAAFGMEDPVSEIRLEGLPSSYHQTPELLGISRILEVPQMVALVAEQTPVVVTGDGWDWTRKTAEALGWEFQVETD